MRCHPLFLLVWTLVLGVVSPGFAEGFPLLDSLAYFPFTPEAPPESGRFNLTVQAAESNVYAVDFNGTAVNDFELSSVLFELRRGLGGGFFLEAYGRFFFAHGGVLDPLIEGFHDLFGLPSARRDAFKKNRVHYSYRDRFDITSATAGSSPLVFAAGYAFAARPSISFFGRVFLGVPLASKPGFVSDRVFGGVGGGVNGHRGVLRYHLSVHLAAIGPPEWLAPEPLNGLMAVVRGELGFRRWRLGGLLRTSPFREGDPGHNGHQIYLGYRIAECWEIGVVEDLPSFDTTPDIGFFVRFRIL